MTKEEFYYDSRDGLTKIHAIRWIPDGEVKAVLQIIHGMAEHIERYSEVAEWFCEKGILVTGDDHLGHGATVSEGATFGYFCENDPATVVVRDEHRLKKMTEEKYPEVPYFILGHSMGSFILRNYMQKYGTGISGAIVCGTGSQPSIVVKTAKLLASVQGLIYGEKHPAKFLNTLAFGDTSKLEKEHINDWLCTDHGVVEKYDADPWCGFLFTVNGFKTLFELIDRLNKKSNVSKMPKKLPVFIISGSEDTVGNCGVGVKKVYNEYQKIGMEDLEYKLYDGLKHEILNEPVRKEIYQDIYSFITKRI